MDVCREKRLMATMWITAQGFVMFGEAQRLPFPYPLIRVTLLIIVYSCDRDGNRGRVVKVWCNSGSLFSAMPFFPV